MNDTPHIERDGSHGYDIGKSPFQSGYELDSSFDKAWRRGWIARKCEVERSARTEEWR